VVAAQPVQHLIIRNQYVIISHSTLYSECSWYIVITQRTKHDNIGFSASMRWVTWLL